MRYLTVLEVFVFTTGVFAVRKGVRRVQEYGYDSSSPHLGHLLGIYGTLAPGSLPGEQGESLEHQTTLPHVNPGIDEHRPGEVPGGAPGQVTFSPPYRPVEATSRTITKTVNCDGSTTYKLLAVTDMDRDGKTDEYKWRAVIRKGALTISSDKKNVTIQWDKNSDQNITTAFNYKGRAMEMSDLSEFAGRLLSPDDKTGMLFDIKNGKAIPWVFLNAGPGNTTGGMKVEWLTTKDGLLYAGGHGVEYRNKKGEVTNEDNMWIKTISPTGEVNSINWKKNFDALRIKAGYPAPGYLTHEAAQWSEHLSKWLFLPRKASKTIYNETEDETKGTNILIMASADFGNIEIIYIGGKDVEHPSRGFSAFDFIPETSDRMLVAIKSTEVTGENTASYVTVFDINGKVYLNDQQLENDYKFEGIYFV